MIESVETVAFGRPATEALARAIEGGQQARRLAPVTVVVASNFAGLAARRTLGGRGLVNVNFVTPLRLAELLAADVLVDRQPLTNPVLASAVRRALAASPPPFDKVADHLATETAVAKLYGELSRLTPDALDAVRSDTWGAVVVDLYERVDALLAGYHDEDAVVRSVLARPDLATVLGPLGHVVWHLPTPLSPAQTQLVAAALSAAPSSVVVALTGAADADARVLHTCRQAGVPVESPPAVTPASAARIVSVTDADEEVRAVVRSIIELAADGVPLDRIGVFYPQPRPYVRIIEHHVLASGLPANGSRIDRLADCVAGRVLRAALVLPDERWRRDRVMALVADAPLRYSGGRARPAVWERVSRDAGVVHDIADWHRKLDLHDRNLVDAIERGHQRWARDRDATRALRVFIDDLVGLVDAVRNANTWSRKVQAAEQLLVTLLGGERSHHRWPEHERDDLDRVVDALTRLATLDPLEPSPTHDTFLQALEAELQVRRKRTNPYGTGLVYGPLAAAAGHDLDAVFLVGLAEGLCPMARREEALLPERVRLLAGGQLDTPDDLMADQHRALLAALASAPAANRTLTFPRGDLRGSRHQLPSRWLLDTASVLAERRVHSTDFADLGPPIVDVSPSFAATLDSSRASPSVGERDLSVVAVHVAAGGDPADHPAAAPVARALVLQRSRRSERFTEFDGNLAGHPVPAPVGEVMSATRIERWAHCGFQYFLHDVVKVHTRDDPERIVTVSPMHRGNAVHQTLERFVRWAIEAGPPEPDEPWSPDQRRRLKELADDCFDEYEALGRTGRTLHWRLQRDLLHDLLRRFVDVDDEHRRTSRVRPVRVEFPFGEGDAAPVEFTLDDGRVVRFRGKIDRVDVDDDGGHIVLDYKTGRGAKFATLDTDPVTAGTTLQLGIYSEAARQLLGAAATAGTYWMLEATKPSGRFAGYPWTDDRRARFMEVLHTIVEGIENGVFVQVPGEWDIFFRTYDNCRHCEYDSVCPVARGDHTAVKVADPALAVRGRLSVEETE